jgi:outer membrane protein
MTPYGETPLISLTWEVRCAPMAKKLSTCVLVVGLLAATEASASASFANRNLGLGVSGFGIVGAMTNGIGIDWGIPITLEGGFYIESGFEVFLRIPLLFAQQKFGVTAGGGPGIVLASGGQFGVKYMFLEESIRPYVTLHLAGLYFIRDSAAVGLNNFFIGPGTSVGVDFFVGESISLGARAYVDMYVTLNVPPNFAIGGGIAANTYF